MIIQIKDIFQMLINLNFTSIHFILNINENNVFADVKHRDFYFQKKMGHISRDPKELIPFLNRKLFEKEIEFGPRKEAQY